MFNSQCSSVDDDLSELKGNTKDLSTSSSSLNESTVLNMRNRKLSDEQIEQEVLLSYTCVDRYTERH